MLKTYPDVFKVKLPPKYSRELERMYDFFFDEMDIATGWAGRIGHYAFDDDPTKNASDQDGYIYAWKHNEYSLLISASPMAYRYKYSLIPDEVEEIFIK